MEPLRRRQKKQIVLAALASCCLLSTGQGDVTWNAAVQNGSWSIASNWIGGVLPEGSENVSILFDDALQHTVVADTDIPQAGTLTFAAQTAGPATLQINQDSSLFARDRFYIAGDGGAEVHQSGGMVRTQWLQIGFHEATSASYFLSGGTLVSPIGMDVGGHGQGSFVQSGGVASVGGLMVGAYNRGTCIVTGGAITTDFINIGMDSGHGTMIQSGGTVAATLSNMSMNLFGYYHLQGGTLITDVEWNVGTFIHSGGFHRTQILFSDDHEMSGGTFVVGKELYASAMSQTGGVIVLGSNSAAGTLMSTGRPWLMSGGTLQVFGTERLSYPIAVHIIQSGGVHLLGDAAHPGSLGIGAKPDFQQRIPSYQLSGGTFTAFGIEDISFSTIDGTGGFGRFSQTGGYHSLTGTMNVGVGGQAGTYELSGGEASLRNVIVGGASAEGTFIVSGGTLSVPGTMQLAANGRLMLDGGDTRVGTLKIAGRLSMPAGATQSLTTSNLSISANGILDLSDNDLKLTYSSASPVDTIVSYLAAGYNQGHWNGTGGITSSIAAADESRSLGYHDNSSSIIVTCSFVGDSNLDGRVDVADLYALASHWQSSAYWLNGDFNYDRFVDSADLTLLAGNWQAGVAAPLATPLTELVAALALPAVMVPEPSAMCVAILLVPVARRRRSLHRRS